MSREHSDRQKPAVELGCLNLLTIVDDSGPDVVIVILSHWVSSTLSIIDTQLYVNKCRVRTFGEDGWFQLVQGSGASGTENLPVGS